MVQYSDLRDVQSLLEQAQQDFPDRLPSVGELAAWVDINAPEIALPDQGESEQTEPSTGDQRAFIDPVVGSALVLGLGYLLQVLQKERPHKVLSGF